MPQSLKSWAEKWSTGSKTSGRGAPSAARLSSPNSDKMKLSIEAGLTVRRRPTLARSLRISLGAATVYDPPATDA